MSAPARAAAVGALWGFAAVLLVLGFAGPGRGLPAAVAAPPAPKAPDHRAMPWLTGPEPVPAVLPLEPIELGAPRELRIPAIGVASPLVPLGRAEDGTLEVPADYAVAGWFRPGPEPGEPGAAVVAGHVDSRTGPAVFARLADLRPGDTVEVAYPAGVARFRVDRLAQYPKAGFPTGEVYGQTPAASLRLITCSGPFDWSTRHYRDNLVVYASAIP
jgi:hypothetical protein